MKERKELQGALFLMETMGKVFGWKEESLFLIEGLSKEEVDLEAFTEYGLENPKPLLNSFKGGKLTLLSSSQEPQLHLLIEGKKNLCNEFLREKGAIKILVSEDKENPNLGEAELRGDKDLRSLGQENHILVAQDKEREDVAIGRVRGYTSPQLVLANGNLYFPEVEKVNSLVIATKGASRSARVIFSLDSGKTWLTKVETEEGWKNEPVNHEDINEVSRKGMDIETFNRIGEGWSLDIVKKGKIRFGYLIGEEQGEFDSIDSLTINLDFYGFWESKVNERDYEYGYGNTKIEMRLFESGKYKINYIE